MRFTLRLIVVISLFYFLGNLDVVSALTLKTSAFKHGGKIPEKYTCSGEDVSPALSWYNAPEGTVSFALICDDPDAPTSTPWVHWVIFNIPKTITSLSEGVKGIGIEGKNSWKNSGYGGPCPPKGHGIHRYFFKLYALDTTLNLKPKANKFNVEAAMNGHILAQAEYMGTFERK